MKSIAILFISTFLLVACGTKGAKISSKNEIDIKTISSLDLDRSICTYWKFFAKVPMDFEPYAADVT